MDSELLKLPVAVLGALFVGLVVLALGAKLLLRFVLTALGRHALDQQPDSLDLKREDSVAWREPARIEALAKPLLEAGMIDCGVFASPKMPGIKIWFLLKESDGVAAFVYEHPKTNPWVELSTRYQDGTTTAVSNLPPTGIELNPPFYRRIVVDPATPTDLMLRTMMAQRPAMGVKTLDRFTVVEEFELAYAKIIVWQKNKGLSAEEVAAVVKKWAEKKAATGGRP